MLFKPRKLFERIKEKPVILLPLAIALLSGLFNGLFSLRGLENLDLSGLPAQSKMVMQIIQGPAAGALTMVFSIIGAAATLFINALILFILFKIVKAKGGYMQAVSLTGTTFYPFMLRDLLRCLFASPASQYNTGAILEAGRKAAAGSVIFDVFSEIGIVFLVWVIILAVKGFSDVYEVKASKAAAVITIFFTAGIIIQAVMTFIGYQMMTNAQPFNLGG